MGTTLGGEGPNWEYASRNMLLCVHDELQVDYTPVQWLGGGAGHEVYLEATDLIS